MIKFDDIKERTVQLKWTNDDDVTAGLGIKEGKKRKEKKQMIK